MISELSKFDRSTRSGILAGLAQELLPNPGISALELPRGASHQLYGELLVDFRKQLKIAQNDNSPSAINKLISFISFQLEQDILKSSKIHSLRERVGQKGNLRPDLYDISFSQNFIDLNSTLGISKERVRKLIENPDFVEHLLPEKYGMESGIATSLFVQTSTKPEANSLLVLALRTKAKLRVDGAWIIFHDEIDTSKIQSPLDLLKVFVERYGVKILCGSVSEKFIIYEKSQILFGAATNVFQLVEPPKNIEIDARFNHSIKGNTVEISVAFALNMTEYISGLIRHGVKVARKKSDTTLYDFSVAKS